MNRLQRPVASAALLLSAFPALAQRLAYDFSTEKAKLVRAIDAIEPWGKTLNYSDEAWKKVSEAAEIFLSLGPSTATDALREYQKSWVPLLRWERMLAPFRRGDFSNPVGGVFSLSDVQTAYRDFVRLRTSTAEPPPLIIDLDSPLPAAVQRASKVYLLLRVIFDLPEKTSESDAISAGDRQFVTAPRFFARNGNEAWPIAWTGQRPRLTAPLFLYRGTPYNAVSDFYLLAQKYRVRNWRDGTWNTTYSLEWPIPGVTELMRACGFEGHANTGSGVSRPSLNFSGDVDPSEMLSFLHRLPEGANSRDAFDWTPLMFAVSTGRLKIARQLIQEGARVNDENYSGITPVMMGANVSELLALLLEHGARLDAADDTGRTPLMYAMSPDNLENVRLLLDKGADPNARDEQGRSALMIAVERADSNRASAASVIQLLLPTSDLRLRTIWGTSLVRLSRKLKDKNIARILGSAGVAN